LIIMDIAFLKFATPAFFRLSLILCLLLIILFFALKKYNVLSFSTWSYLLKSALLLCLLLALALPYSEKVSRSSKAFLLLDISESMDPALGDLLLDKARKIALAETEIEVIPFAGAAAGATLSLSSIRNFQKVKNSWARLDTGVSNIEKAIQTLLAENSASILLISDGFETKGNVLQVLDSSSGGHRFFPLLPPDPSSRASTFRLSNLHAPLSAPAQKSVEVRVSVLNSTSTAQNGRLLVQHDQQEILNKVIEVAAGKEIIIKADSDPSQEGIKEISARLVPEDTLLSPSSALVYLSGEEREKLLLLSGNAVDEKFLKQLLQKQSYRLVSKTAKISDSEDLELSKYSVVLFNNIPRSDLPRGLISRVDKYVRHGGSFIMLGGNKSFGLGNYLDTEMEALLPVEMLPPSTVKKRLNIAVGLVLDKSRSMAFGSKIEYAKEAAVEVVKNLKDADFITVIGFDSTPFVAVPILQIKGNRALALSRVKRLFPSGKTNLFPAMDEARRSLLKVKAGRKHMIVLTDGKIPDAGSYYYELVQQMRIQGITLSTVMMGSEADLSFLRDMAESGGGAFYQTSNARNLPRIFLSDIKVSTGERSLQENQEYLVRRGPAGLKSTQIKSFPPLRGYVQTKSKEKARLELVTTAAGRAEPLMARWNYYKGQSLAFTSDANGRWSSFWVTWRKFSEFWTDIIDSLRPEADADTEHIRFDLRYFVEHGYLNLDLSVFSENAAGKIAGTLKFPDETESEIAFTTLSRGHYQATSPRIMAGKYELHLRAAQKTLTPVAFNLAGELFGEKRGQGFNVPLLEALAGKTGGQINPDSEQLKSQVYEKIEKKELAYLFLLLALILLCSEIFRREVLRGRSLSAFIKSVRPS